MSKCTPASTITRETAIRRTRTYKRLFGTRTDDLRLSIARSLGIALTALTVVLAVVAGMGVSRLYKARQHYETTLAQTSNVQIAVANLTSAGISEAEVLRDAAGARAHSPCGRQARL